mmetsp:Transcript_14451/g.28538  ORF Transcript_14451/g.28538 Transcript_14451/m.28538 type:complete len:253 (+) Transcript_14451:695-1453(+)
MSVKHHLALVRVVEPLYQLDRRALAAPRRPDERTRGARGDMEVVPVAHRLVRPRRVRELNVLKLDQPLYRRGLLACVREGVDGGHPPGEGDDLSRGLSCLDKGCDGGLHHPETLRTDLEAEHGDEEVSPRELAFPDVTRVDIHGVPTVSLDTVERKFCALELPRTHGAPVPEPDSHHQVARGEEHAVGEAHLDRLGDACGPRRLQSRRVLLCLDVLHVEGSDGSHLRERLTGSPSRLGVGVGHLALALHGRL